MTRGGTTKSPFHMRQEIKGQTGPNGRPLCTWCKQEVPKGRRSWCSDKCVEEYRELNDWGYVRRKVFKRDRGVCANCGSDTEQLKERFRKTMNWIMKRRGYQQYYHHLAKHVAGSWIDKWLKKYGIPFGRLWSDWWDADHIKPVVEGGTNELSNLRTLCIACHKRETDELKRRMAEKRKEMK